MTEIENRIVSIVFDNSKFEKNIEESRNSLQKFDDKIKNVAASNDFSKVADSLSKSVASISNKFTLGGRVLLNVFDRISNKLINMLTQFRSQKDGLAEYEMQIGSVQTIMANTGRSVDDVNKALDELNAYADKTIYNFSQMTHNAGLFTAAIGNQPDALEKSTKALKGIGNWAAYAGTDATTMARATYQLSQGAAAGAIRLMDWRSIENAGGMAGANYRKAFIETAEEMGVLKKGKVTLDDFRDSLKNGWLTADVFFKTMEKFADDPAMTAAATKVKTFTQLIDTLREALGSGWAQTFREIIGDFEEAREFWSGWSNVLNDLINKSSAARNELVGGWAKNGGRFAAIDSLKNIFLVIADTVVIFKSVMRDLIPSKTSKDLVLATKSFEAITKSMVDWITSIENVEKVSTIFRGFFNLVDIGKKTVSAFSDAVGYLLQKLFPSVFPIDVTDRAGGFLNVLVKLNEQIIDFNSSLSENDIYLFFKNIADTAADAIINVVRFFTEFKNMMIKKDETDEITTLGAALFNLIRTLAIKVPTIAFNTIKGVVDDIRNGVEAVEAILTPFYNLATKIVLILTNIIENIGDSIGEVLTNIVRYFTTAITNITQVFAEADSNQVFGYAGTLGFVGLFTSALYNLNKITNNVATSFDLFIKSAQKIGSQVGEVLGELHEVLKAYSTDIRADSLLKIAKAVGILAISFILLSSVDLQTMITSMIALKSMSMLLIDTLDSLVKTLEGLGDVKKMAAVVSGTGALVAISTSLLLLSSAVVMLAATDPEKALGALAAVIFVIEIYKDFITDISKLPDGSKPINTFTKGIVSFSIAVSIIAASMKSLSKVKDTTSLLIAFSAIASIIFMFESVIKSLNQMQLDNTGKFMQSLDYFTRGIIGFSIAVAIIAGSMKSFAKIGDPTPMLVSLGAILLIMSTYYAIIRDLNEMQFKDPNRSMRSLSSFTNGILGFSVAVAIISNSMTSFAKIGDPWVMLTSIGSVILIMGTYYGMIKGLNEMNFYGSRDFTKPLSYFTKGIIGFSIAVSIIASSMSLFASVKDPTSMLVAFVAVETIMLTYYTILSKLNGMNFKDNKQSILHLDYFINSLHAFAMCVAIIAASMTLFALVKDPSPMLISFGSIVLLIQFMISKLQEINRMTSKLSGKETLKLQSIALMISAMVVAVGAALTAVANSGDSVLAAAASIASVMAVLVGLMYLMKEMTLTMSEGDYLRLSGMMVAIGAAISMVTATLAVLSKIDPTALITSAAAMGIAAAAIGALLGIITIISAVAGEFSPAVLMISGSITLLALAAAAIAGSFYLTAAALDAFTESMERVLKLGNKLDEARPLIIKAAQFMMDTFLVLVEKILVGLLNALHEISAPLVQAIVDIAIELIRAIDDILQALAEEAPAIAYNLVMIIGGIILGVAAGLDTLMNDSKYSDPIAAQGKKTVETFKMGVEQGLDGFGEWFFDTLLSAMGYMGYKKQEKLAADSMANAAKSIIADARSGEIDKAIETYGKDFKSNQKIGQALLDSLFTNLDLSTATTNLGHSVEGVFMNLDLEDVAKMINIYDEYVAVGKQIPNGVLEGIAENSGYAIDEIRWLCEHMEGEFRDYNAIHSPSQKYIELAKNIVKGLEEGIDLESPEAQAKILDLAKDMEDSMDKGSDSMLETTKDKNSEFLDEQDGFNAGVLSSIMNMNSSFDSELSAVKSENEQLNKALKERQSIYKQYADGYRAFEKERSKEGSIEVGKVVKKERYVAPGGGVPSYLANNPDIKWNTGKKIVTYEKEVSQAVMDAEGNIHMGTAHTLAANEEEYVAYMQQLASEAVDIVEDTSEKTNSISEDDQKKAKERLKEMVNDVKDAYKEYTDAQDSAKEDLKNKGGIFDAVDWGFDPENPVTKETLKKNLEDQIAQVRRYNAAMASLNDKITNEELKKTIESMGVDKLEELEVLDTMSDSELKSYEDLFANKMAEAVEGSFYKTEVALNEMGAKVNKTLGTNMNTDEIIGIIGDEFGGEVDENTIKRLAEVGGNLTEGIILGMTDDAAKGEIKDAAVETGDNFEEALASSEAFDINSPSKRLRDTIGRYAMEGIIEGMTDEEAAQKVRDMAVMLTAWIVNQFREKIDDYKNIGVFMGINIARGLEEGAANIQNAIQNVGNSASENAGLVVSAAGRALKSKNVSPTITPVYNSSSLDMYNKSMNNSLMGQRSFMLANQANANMSTEINKTIKVDNGNVIAAINRLDSDLLSVGERVNSLQVRLDSGALVGQIAPQMNSALGMQALRTGRYGG